MKNLIETTYHSVAITLINFVVFGVLFSGDPGFQQIGLSMLILGGVMGVTALIYEFNSLPIFVSLLIHLSISLATFIGIGIWNNFFGPNLMAVVFSALLFIVIFILIWTLFYLQAKKEVSEINNHLNK